MKWLLLLLALSGAAFANNPGGHDVQLSWTDTCASGQTCSYNVYRGTASGVCGTGMIPFANTPNLAYEDDTAVAGTTYFYAVTQLPSGGGESGCSVQLQLSVPSSSGSVPTLFSGQGH